MKSHLFILFFIFIFLPVQASVPEVKVTNGPFWQRKQKILKRIRERRDIMVNVKSLNGDKKLKTLEMQGVGVVNSSIEQSYETAKNFSNLEKVSGHIKKIQFNEAKRQLFMHSEAFNYHAKMWMLVDLDDKEDKKQIRFLVEKGVFKGMRGSITFFTSQISKSRIEFLAVYNYTELPVPRFFVEFGLEVVVQKIAAKMRTFIEEFNREGKAS